MLGSLAEFEWLSLQQSFLTGTIPSSIFNLSSLLELDFSNNSLTGSFRDDLCQRIPLLQGFYMTNNHFTGSIPRNLRQCKDLSVVSLSLNQLTGTIPRDIGNLTSLKKLYLSFDNLIGTYLETSL